MGASGTIVLRATGFVFGKANNAQKYVVRGEKDWRNFVKAWLDSYYILTLDQTNQ